MLESRLDDEVFSVECLTFIGRLRGAIEVVQSQDQTTQSRSGYYWDD